MRRLVLGLGNDLLGDDGIGSVVAEALRRRPSLHCFDFQVADSGGLALLDLLSGYDEAVIIDCVAAGDGPEGEVRRLRPGEFRAEAFTLSSHYLGLPEVLALAGRLKLPMPDLDVVTISVRDPYRVGRGLSRAMRRALPVVLAQIERWLIERVLVEEARA